MPEFSAAVVWLVVGLVLMVMEALTPGVFMVWLGLAAIGTGIVVWLLAPVFWVQVVTFGVLAIAAVLAGLRLRKAARPSRINTAESGLVGRSASVLSFDGREGRVRLGDSDWSARLSGDSALPTPGARVQVVAVNGTVLVVRAGAV